MKTGARYRTQTRDRDQNRGYFDYVGPNGARGPAGAANDDNLDRFFDPGYNYLPAGMLPIDWLKIPELQASHRDEAQSWSRNRSHFAETHFAEDPLLLLYPRPNGYNPA